MALSDDIIWWYYLVAHLWHYQVALADGIIWWHHLVASFGE